MKVPLLDLKRQTEALLPQLRAAFERVMASGVFILGPEVEKLEALVGQRVGVAHAIGVSSGTDAILLALMALDIGPGDEVICPSFTFFATAGCIARTGARPVFADSLPDSFNLDVQDARKRITARTRAILPVHLFGQMADMDAVMELAREHGLRVIEDAAQSLGAAYRGRPAGSIGDFGTFSFYPSKNLGGFGDAGMLVTADTALAAKARLLRTHGAKPKYVHKMVGGNFRIDPLQAAMIAVKMAHLDAYTAARAANAAYYHERLAALDGVGTRILLPAAAAHNKHIWNQYTLRVTAGKRDALKSFLQARHIGAEIYYPLPLHMQECFPPQPGSARPSLPVCERLAAECISIPIYPEMRRQQQDAAIAAIGDFLKSGAQ